MSGGRFSNPMAYGMDAESGSFDRSYDPKAEDLRLGALLRHHNLW